jgi:hypothetical protein
MDTTIDTRIMDTTTDPQLVLVPEGADCVDDLHVVELASVSRKLGVDVMEAIAGGANSRGLRWDAFIHLAHVWAKRTDPKATVEQFHALTPQQLLTALRMDEDDDQAAPGGTDEDPTANPTDPAPA